MKFIILSFAILSSSINCFSQKTISKIAFGSCGKQYHPLPIFDVIVGHQPDLFVFLGDNIYADTDNMDTMKAKWLWLEKELQKPADLRIIGSGSQFGIEYNSYESWANFPLEQQKMIDLIKKTKANGVLFLSGDVHYAEISKLSIPGMYPIYDITSSGLSSKWHFATPNNNRIEGPVMENHFGLLTIDWEHKNPVIKMEVWDINNNQRFEYTIRLDELQFK